jgi:hypothetical protein
LAVSLSACCLMSHCMSFAADADLSFMRPLTWRRRETSVEMIRGRTPCAASEAGTSGIFSSSA